MKKTLLFSSLFLLSLLTITLSGFKKRTLLESKSINHTEMSSIAKKAFFTNTVSPGTYYPGQVIVTTSNASVYLIYQTDGNLVLYTAQGVAIWCSGPVVNDAAYCEFDTLGGIKLHRGSSGATVYASFNTGGCPFTGGVGAYVLQEDGNFVHHFNNTCEGNGVTATGTQGGAVSSHFHTFQ